MTRQHVGAVAGLVVGFVLSRILAYSAVGVIGSLTGHSRSLDEAVGVVITGLPFIALAAHTLLHLRRSALTARLWLKVVWVASWAVAGGVVGLLPYSRAGAIVGLRSRELAVTPGLLGGIDRAILVGLALTVALLLVALRYRGDHARPALQWIEEQLSDPEPTDRAD